MALSARLLAVATVLLLSIAAQAQQLSIFPPAPTTDDEVTLRSLEYCLFREQTVTRTGNEIAVTLRISACPSPPTGRPYDISLGELPAGQYRVTVTYGSAESRTLSFVVRNAEPVPFTLRPWAVPTTGGLDVHLDVDVETVCLRFDCSAFRLEIEGRVYGLSDLLGSGRRFAFVAPAHAAGPVDVKMTNGRETVVVPAGLVYFDPSAPPDPSIFERVLFPVLFSSDGANSSRWRSEAVIVNPNPWAVQNWNDVRRLVCIDYPCGERLPPKSRHPFEGEGYPRGVALLVPRGESEDLSFSLRVRDISRDAEGYGAQVPVVRERDMFRNSEVPLLDVPLDPRFRTRVRIYAFPDPAFADSDQPPLAAGVRIGLETRVVELKQFCDGFPECATVPFYGELDLAPGAQGERSDVYVELPEGAHGWAFASVTNNTTQQVTIVAPDGKGGRP
jgi:hypothetical protein